ncbi:MAG: 5-formyltetrahydrofolate cyclo-ligase [Eubacteriales bacterium]|nr:5-formyltetrahydrofolate cyclo-ligase [Eubacteriales bacterium]
MTIDEQKRTMRSQMRAQCKALQGGAREAFSAAACERLAALPAFIGASCILAYKAMPHECDPQRLVEIAWEMGKKIAFPVCAEDYSLRLWIPKTRDAFLKGKYGIWEPDPSRAAQIEADALDLIVVPGVAFDASCRRLGQGAGYYDRLLQTVGAVKIGVAFPLQIVASVPVRAHDVALDVVVTADTVFSR